MSTANRLLELIDSWIEQRQLHAKQLRKLALELEQLREKCNVGECVGSSVSVLGATCAIGAGVATLFTGGLAALALAGLGAMYTVTGGAISVVSQLTEHLKSSDTMKEAEKIGKKTNKIEENMKKELEQLKAEVEDMSSFADPDEVDQHVMAEILRAIARQSGLKWVRGLDSSKLIRMFDYKLKSVLNTVLEILNLAISNPAVVPAGILMCFTLRLTRGKKIWLQKGAQRPIMQLSKLGLKTIKGSAMVRLRNYTHA